MALVLKSLNRQSLKGKGAYTTFVGQVLVLTLLVVLTTASCMIQHGWGWGERSKTELELEATDVLENTSQTSIAAVDADRLASLEQKHSENAKGVIEAEEESASTAEKKRHYAFLRQGVDSSGVRSLRLNFEHSKLSRNLAWNSCAVVGNSGNARGQGYGSSIDAHDVVIRLNFAPVEDHVQDVGRKTTIAFVNGWKLSACSGANTTAADTTSKKSSDECSCWKYYSEGKKTHIVAYAILEEHVAEAERCLEMNPGKLYLVNDSFKQFCNDVVHHYVSERIKRTYPRDMWPKLAEERRRVKLHYSSGFQAVAYALSLCDKVDLFGFGATGEGDTHHYFENQTLEEIPDHDYEAEQIFYKEVENEEEILSFFPFRAKRFQVY